jgi:Na+-driven multidrug efflux pump
MVVLPYALLSPILFRAFTGNADVVAACVSQVRAVSWATAGVVLSLVAVSGLQGMGKALPSLALIAARLGVFLLLPVFLLSASGLLGFGSFLAVFAASSVLGGALSIHVFRRLARGLPVMAEAGLSS